MMAADTQTPNEKNVKDAIGALEKNPLFWLSAGARENSVSYFLKWLFDTYPDLIRALVRNAPEGPVSVKREKYNFDLIIESKKSAIVVENKIKSLPTDDQLERYNLVIESKFQNKRVKKILLSMITTECERCGWEFLSYADLEEKINGCLNGREEPIPPSHQIYIDDMLTMFRQCSEILQFFEKEQSFWFDLDKESEVWHRLQDVRFEDTVTKFLASEFHTSILEKLPCDIKNDTHFRSMPGMQRKAASVDFYFTTAEKDQKISDKDVTLFIQIEANTYRWAIEYKDWNLPKNRSAHDLAKRLNNPKVSGLGWLPCKKEKLLNFENGKSFATSMTKEYSSYSPGFIYRYANIGGAGGIKVGDLKNQIKHDLSRAKAMIRKVPKSDG